MLNLNTPDFTTAARLADSINASLGAGVAESIDPISVRVRAPGGGVRARRVPVAYRESRGRARAGRREGDRQLAHRHGRDRRERARERRRRRARLAGRQDHGDGARESAEPFARGDTVVVAQSDIEVDQGDGRMFVFEPGTTLNDIVDAVNQVGAAPGDLVAILEALREAGALRAQLIVI